MWCHAAWTGIPGSSSATATRTSSLGMASEPAAEAAASVETLPGSAVERAATRRPRGRRAALRGARGRRLPFPRSCRHRHGSPWTPLLGVAGSLPHRTVPRQTRRYRAPWALWYGCAALAATLGGPVAASGDVGAGDAVGLRLEGELEERGEHDVRVRPALVGQDRDGDVLARAASGRRPARRGIGRSGRAWRGRRR